MSTQQRQILITMALPYANGPTHLGHLVEAIQADIWARFQRLQGHRCLFVCGNDVHGTTTMLAAQKQNIAPEQLIETISAQRYQDYQDFHIQFDNFHTTHSAENQTLANLFYQRLKDRGDIKTQTIKQLYDPQENIFLADRYIQGECPYCHASDQYGDNCEKCGKTYSPTELINPISTLSGVRPIEKESVHYFLDITKYQQELAHWVNDDHLQPQVANKLNEWFEQGLKAWDISRDAPYFGFEIPDAPGKYFYVWLDAPIGYIASFEHLCQQRPDLNFADYWAPESTSELYHFIGKDIIYFHALFWPAMLKGANFRLPSAIFVHGFLTINGKKMSKSRGTFITVGQYLAHFPAEALRYYFAAKLNSQVEDIDLNLEDFMLRVNADLVGKYVNLASRCAGFITKKFAGQLAKTLPDPELYEAFVQQNQIITQAYEAREYNRVTREIMALADRANQYIDQHKPWGLAKDPAQADQVQAICTQGLNLFKLLTTYLKPILPIIAAQVENFLQCDELNMANLATPLLDHTITPFKPLLHRITPDAIEALLTTTHHEKA